MQTLTLVERHEFRRSHKDFKELDRLCFLSKNLYNSALYQLRQSFFASRRGQGKLMTYSGLAGNFAQSDQPDFRALPAKVSQHVLKQAVQSFKSFFALLKLKKASKYDEPVRLPGYMDKLKGRNVLTYTNQAISTKKKPGYVNLSGTNIFVKTKVNDVEFVRVTPHRTKGIIVVEIGYKAPLLTEAVKERKIAAVDIGVNILAALTVEGERSILINGRPLKSINQYYNKHNAKLKAQQDALLGPPVKDEERPRTRRMKSLSRKRYNKVRDYLHKASRWLTNSSRGLGIWGHQIPSYLVSRGVTDLIIGHTKYWKQDVSLGDQRNQNFVSIPFNDFIAMLTYKGLLAGIRVHIVEESYTSKASAMDLDSLPTYDEVKESGVKPAFSGYRHTRGMYKSKTQKRYIHADVNGSLNILRRWRLEQGLGDITILPAYLLAPPPAGTRRSSNAVAGPLRSINSGNPSLRGIEAK